MPKRDFTEELLYNILERDKAVLIGEYDTKSTTCHTTIPFICNCGERTSKKFVSLANCGAFCKSCSKKLAREKTVKTNRERYGFDTPAQNKEIHDKMTKTCESKYGVKNPFQNKDIKQKIKETLTENFGVDHPSKSKELNEKKQQTCLKNYGVKNPSQSKEVKAKKVETCLENHKVAYPTQSSDVKEKCKETSRKHYGVDYPNQSLEYQIQNQHKGYKRKVFVMPSGDIRIVQGDEQFAIQQLLEERYTEEQIKTRREDIPRIQYNCNGKQRSYFPDIFLPHENKLIEVKSTRTYDIDWNKKLKYQKEECDKLYNYEIWVYNQKKQRVFVL
jgi:hypothetical protein